MALLLPDPNGLYHPKDEAEIIELIQIAIQNKLQVRVRGAAQSATGSVFSDGFSTQPSSVYTGKNINIELDKLRSVTIDASSMQVTVGGGCNLGVDPFDPSGTSQNDDSQNLFFQLNQKGLAIPNVPDAIHQTVAGFISTGSSGGSMQHSFDECILAIRIIDGTGKVNTFTKSANLDDPFYGAVVSMGLLGIITEVTLQCVPAFNIIGEQTVTPVAGTEFDFFGPGSATQASLQTFLTNTEFTRTMWWPFKTLERAVVWKARKMTDADYNKQTGIPPNFIPKPYQSIFRSHLGSAVPSEAFAATGFSLIANWPNWFYEILGVSPKEATLKEDAMILLIEKVFPYLYPKLIDIYFNPKNPPQNFWDIWFNSLPMDKVEYSNGLFNAVFTEMWIPIDQAMNVVNTMQNKYTELGYEATGFFTTEIFAAKSSNFWLSPAYQQDSIRINLLWFGLHNGDPIAYFTQFWNWLATFKFRPHWGKSLPAYNSSQGATYLQNSYPKWANWQALRDQMDPNQIFVSEYWRNQLAIKAAI